MSDSRNRIQSFANLPTDQAQQLADLPNLPVPWSTEAINLCRAINFGDDAYAAWYRGRINPQAVNLPGSTPHPVPYQAPQQAANLDQVQDYNLLHHNRSGVDDRDFNNLIASLRSVRTKLIANHEDRRVLLSATADVFDAFSQGLSLNDALFAAPRLGNIARRLGLMQNRPRSLASSSNSTESSLEVDEAAAKFFNAGLKLAMKQIKVKRPDGNVRRVTDEDLVASYNKRASAPIRGFSENVVDQAIQRAEGLADHLYRRKKRREAAAAKRKRNQGKTPRDVQDLQSYAQEVLIGRTSENDAQADQNASLRDFGSSQRRLRSGKVRQF